MKKIYLFMLTAGFCCLTVLVHAQEKSKGMISVEADQVIVKSDPTFTAHSMTYDPDTKVMTLSGNVRIKTDRLNVRNADKIVYDETNKKMIIEGGDSFTFKGTLIVNQAKGDHKRKLVYIVGSDELIIE